MGKTLKIKIMPKFEKSTGYQMKGPTFFGKSPLKQKTSETSERVESANTYFNRQVKELGLITLLE